MDSQSCSDLINYINDKYCSDTDRSTFVCHECTKPCYAIVTYNKINYGAPDGEYVRSVMPTNKCIMKIDSTARWVRLND